MATTVTGSLELRDATPADNEALLELTAACTMHGDIGLRMDRAPDFFALSRIEGESVRVGVVTDAGGRVVGCAAAARRIAYLNGAATPTSYAYDLKVHPSARRSAAADLLSLYVRDAAGELAGPDAPCLLTILAGNASMERRARGPRGTPVLSRFATLAVTSIPLLWKRDARVSGVSVRDASPRDVEEMATVWRRIAVGRQFAAALDADSLAAWISNAPGLAIEDYLLATSPSGRIVGFVGVWDQTAFKQMRVVSYSPRLAVVRRGFNLIAPFAGVPSLPAPGGALPAVVTVHLCAEDPTVLRALLLAAYSRLRGGRFTFMTVSLDVRDPLLAATRGLLGQPTMVNAYVSNPRGYADPGFLRPMPLHYESSLV